MSPWCTRWGSLCRSSSPDRRDIREPEVTKARFRNETQIFFIKLDKYSGDLKSRLDGFYLVKKRSGLQMVYQILNGIWCLEAWPFEIRKNGCHVVKNHLKFRQKSSVFEWSGFQIVKTYSYRPILLKLDYLKSDLPNSVFGMFLEFLWVSKLSK